MYKLRIIPFIMYTICRLHNFLIDVKDMEELTSLVQGWDTLEADAIMAFRNRSAQRQFKQDLTAQFIPRMSVISGVQQL